MKKILHNRRRSPARGDPRRHEQGTVLVLALMISVLMAILAIPYMSKLSGRYKTSERIADTLAARYLAEAGAERSIWELNFGDFTGWSAAGNQMTLTLADVQSSNGTVIGSISIVVTDPYGDLPIIESTGSVVHTGSATINKTIRVTASAPPNIFNQAVYGITKVNIHEHAYLDSYDPALGPYGGDNVRANATVSGNTPSDSNNITIDQDAVVNGNAFCGKNTNPVKRILTKGNSVITGTRMAQTANKVYTPCAIPTGLTNMGNFTADHGETVTISSSGKYGNFEIKGKSYVNIVGDVTLHLTTKLKIDPDCTLNVAAGSRLSIVLDNNDNTTLDMDPYAIITNQSHNPDTLYILGTTNCTGDLTFQTKDDFYGSVFLPKAKFHVDGTPQFFGAIIAKELELKGTTQFHYDEALSNTIPKGVTNPVFGSLVVKSWQGL